MQNTLRRLLKNEGGICVSLLLPTHYKAFPDRKKVEIAIHNGLREVEKKLHAQAEKTIAQKLIGSVEALLEEVDLNHPPQAIGIFVTQGFAQLVRFPASVEQKVVVSDTFEIQDILYNISSITYHVLLLNKNHTRLFKGIGLSLHEVKDHHFPYGYEDDHQKGPRASTHAMHSNDPSKVEHHRMEAFFHEVKKRATPYIKDYPLLLIGMDKHIGYYKKAAPHNHQVSLGEVHASYNTIALPKLIEVIEPFAVQYQREAEEALIAKIKTKIQRGDAFQQVDGVLSALKQSQRMGRLHLITERDFEVAGYRHNTEGTLSLGPSEGEVESYDAIPNIAEHMVEQVIKRKDGHVSVVAPNLLKAYGRIVLVKE